MWTFYKPMRFTKVKCSELFTPNTAVNLNTEYSHRKVKNLAQLDSQLRMGVYEDGKNNNDPLCRFMYALSILVTSSLPTCFATH